MKFANSIVEHESYRPDDLRGARCVDLIPNINPKSAIDMDILKSWQYHLEQQGVPYYVARISETRWALFKERRCDYAEE